MQISPHMTRGSLTSIQQVEIFETASECSKGDELCSVLWRKSTLVLLLGTETLAELLVVYRYLHIGLARAANELCPLTGCILYGRSLAWPR